MQVSDQVSQIPPGVKIYGAQAFADLSSILGRYGTTIEIYDYLIDKAPESAKYYEKKANYLQITGQLEEAVTALDGAIARDQENPDYLYKKARILRSLNRTLESDAIYTKIETISPKNAHEFVICGDAALDRSLYLQAYEHYNRAVNANPSDYLTWEKRGDVIFALLTIYTGGLHADESFKKKDLYSEGIRSYENAIHLNSAKASEIKEKMGKRSDTYVPKSIAELESRYSEYRYLD